MNGPIGSLKVEMSVFYVCMYVYVFVWGGGGGRRGLPPSPDAARALWQGLVLHLIGEQLPDSCRIVCPDGPPIPMCDAPLRAKVGLE